MAIFIPILPYLTKQRFAQLAKYLPFLPVFGGGATRFQPVSVDDVADLVYNAVTTDTYDGKIVETGGPKVYTYREMMELMLKSAGMSRLLVSLPWVSAIIINPFKNQLSLNTNTEYSV